MNARSFLVSSGVTYVGAAMTIVLMAAFYVVSLRINTEAFGELQAMLSFMFLLNAGRSVAGGYIVIHAAGDPQLLGPVVRLGAKLTTLTALAIAAMFVVAAPFLRDFLHLDSLQSFFFMAAAAVPSMATGFFDGILNVQKRFTALSISANLWPIANMALALLLFGNGFQESDTGWIILGAQIFSCLNVFFIDWSFLKSDASFTPSRSTLRETAELMSSSLLFGIAMRMDVFWAKHVLSPLDAGIYAVAASIAIVLYLVGGSLVRVTSVSLRSGSGMNVVFASLALMLATCALLAGGFALMGKLLLNTLVGHAVEIDWAILWPLFAAITCFSVVMFDYACLNILERRVHVGIGILLVGTSAPAFFFWGHDAHSIAAVRLLSMAAITLVFTVSLLRVIRRRAVVLAENRIEPHVVHQA